MAHRSGRPALYPLSDLAIGKARLFRWHADRFGYPDTRRNSNIGACVALYARRTGRRFRTDATPRGLLVTRLL